MKLYLGIGSNIGNKEENIEKSISLLNKELKTKFIKKSNYYYSKSWGFKGEDFVNIVIEYETEIDANELLTICKSIEKQLGREENIEYNNQNERIYHNRIIDIDILTYSDLEIKTETLTIPHPLMKERDFVMIPLNEIIE